MTAAYYNRMKLIAELYYIIQCHCIFVNDSRVVLQFLDFGKTKF